MKHFLSSLPLLADKAVWVSARAFKCPPPLFAAALLLLLAAAFLVHGHAVSRLPQLLLLVLPGVALLLWPVRSRRLHQLRFILVVVWVSVFVLDGVVRAFLDQAYQAAPDSALVVSAVANTNFREGIEYFRSLGPVAFVWPSVLILVFAAIIFLAAHGARSCLATSRLFVIGLSIALCLSTLAYVLKPMRKFHPAVFWTAWAQSIHETRKGWAHLQAQREAMQHYANRLHPQIDTVGPATIVLVISDSVNRDNLALYGYARETTPALLGLKDQLGDHMLVLRNAWSSAASTLPSLNGMLSLRAASGQGSESAHIIAMAKAAGYRTWWISNHDDMAIEQQHAKLADVVDIVNRTPGRSGTSLDSELLDCVQEALDEPHQRKFIVVHLLGAHPHYELRYPEDQNPFMKTQDAIDIGLARQGRSVWVRNLREKYDAAILFHDQVVAETFRMAKAGGASGSAEYRAWMYLSDHGQEVGHTRDFAGHSPNTAAGYRIPAMIWRNSEWPVPNLTSTAFRSDWTSWTLADLLNLHWDGYRQSHNVLSANYEWKAPDLPIQVKSYIE